MKNIKQNIFSIFHHLIIDFPFSNWQMIMGKSLNCSESQSSYLKNEATGLCNVWYFMILTGDKILQTQRIRICTKFMYNQLNECLLFFNIRRWWPSYNPCSSGILFIFTLLRLIYNQDQMAQGHPFSYPELII